MKKAVMSFAVAMLFAAVKTQESIDKEQNIPNVTGLNGKPDS